MSIRACRRLGLALLLSLAMLPAAKAATVFEQEFTCPIGGEEFRQKMAGSGTSFGQFFDFRPYGPIESPWPLPVCPGNGFVMFKREFSDAELARLSGFVGNSQSPFLGQ